MTALAVEPGRRVILVLTDASASRTHLVEVDKRARDRGFMIYAILVWGRNPLPRDTPGLIRTLAEDTGGGHFELERDGDLRATFARVADELRTQYVLGFTPRVLDGKIHRLDVRIARARVKVRARRSYLAVSR